MTAPVRKLSLAEVTAIGIGAMIGGGIFAVVGSAIAQAGVRRQIFETGQVFREGKLWLIRVRVYVELSEAQERCPSAN